MYPWESELILAGTMHPENIRTDHFHGEQRDEAQASRTCPATPSPTFDYSKSRKRGEVGITQSLRKRKPKRG